MTPRSVSLLCALLAIGSNAAFAGQEPVSFGAPVAAAQLSDLRGGTDTTVNDIRLRGTTAGNSATNVQTGTNTITAGAFGQMNGIPVVIQNTGANVLIQNSLILNLRLQ
ncbi:hypothetical protein JJB11_09875 [Ramlibacter ginsenosidimutans]|uniref:Uncharacterized protein n=1 Tax=Ramlibacter ginsenosidimutans TaxID=502333 RepID=A0A934TS32_9BURK|nr:hypothetical protein [Ramlibacter ginsenosidimutans]MBK6006399.1 hypothetical protein [Ramlibacter ginsenosidimutans]